MIAAAVLLALSLETSHTFAEALISRDRSPEIAASEDVYAKLLGVWSVEARDRTDNGTFQVTAGEWLFARTLVKPIKPSSLLGVVTEVVGLAAPRRPPSRAATLDPGLATRHPLRVLLAEDNPINQRVAVAMLKKLGYAADVAGNGREAIEALARQGYDLILMDVQMPEVDGLDATRRLRVAPGGERPHVVIEVRLGHRAEPVAPPLVE